MAATPYCSEADVRLIAEVDTSELEAANIDLMTERAEAEINSFLGQTYDVPFLLGDIPEKIRWLCAQLTSAYILQKVYIGTAPNQSPYSDKLLEMSMDELARLRDGEEVIIVDGADLAGPSMLSSTPSQQVIFTVGTYRDASLLTFIDDARIFAGEGISYFNLAVFLYLYN